MLAKLAVRRTANVNHLAGLAPQKFREELEGGNETVHVTLHRLDDGMIGLAADPVCDAGHAPKRLN